MAYRLFIYWIIAFGPGIQSSLFHFFSFHFFSFHFLFSLLIAFGSGMDEEWVGRRMSGILSTFVEYLLLGVFNSGILIYKHGMAWLKLSFEGIYVFFYEFQSQALVQNQTRKRAGSGNGSANGSGINPCFCGPIQDKALSFLKERFSFFFFSFFLYSSLLLGDSTH